MDIPSELIILAIIIVFFGLFMLLGVENSIPLYVRTSFDDVCNSYLAIIERDSGLTTAQKNNLVAELGTLGISNVIVTAPMPAAGNWGQKVKLKVIGDYSFTSTNASNLSKRTETKPIKYEMNTIILTLPD